MKIFSVCTVHRLNCVANILSIPWRFFFWWLALNYFVSFTLFTPFVDRACVHWQYDPNFQWNSHKHFLFYVVVFFLLSHAKGFELPFDSRFAHRTHFNFVELFENRNVCVHWHFNLVTDSLESHKHFFYPLPTLSRPARCHFATQNNNT